MEAGMTEPRVVTLLHLSDVHFKSSQKWEQTIVLNALMRDVLTKLDSQELLPDFILITGDIAYSGLQSEYVQAERFFKEVAKITATDPKTAWFLVPGNHDVNRTEIKPLARISAAAVQDVNQVNAILSDEVSRSLFTFREHAFFEFTSSFLGEDRAWSELTSWRVETRTVRGLPIAFLALNSAWSAEGGDQDQGRLLLGEFQVREAIATADALAPTLKIALMHHPLDWLRSFDQERVRALLLGPGGTHFLFRGHLHMGRIARQDSPDANCIELAAGALWQDSSFPHGVNVVRLDVDKGRGEAHLFRYSSEGRGFWKRDNFLYENVNEGKWVFDLPENWGISRRLTKGVPPRKTTQESAPVLDAVSGSFDVRVDVEWDRSTYRAGTDLCSALVTIQIDEPTYSEQRQSELRTPVHHVLVLDVSGSMNEPNKYPVLAEAVDLYLGMLAPTDLVSLVPFSSESQVLISSLSISRIRQQQIGADGVLSAWPYRFSSTLMAPALRLAKQEIDGAKNAGFEGVVRVLCLTDGHLHDYLACRPLAQELRDSGAGVSLFGFGEDFDASSAEALADEADGTVRYVRTTGKELEEYFGHMARTSQRIVLRDASLSLHLAENVTCFNVFSCRPHERHIGRFEDSALHIVTHQMGALRYGTPYILLMELRAWEPKSPIAELHLDATSIGEPLHLSRRLSPSFGSTTGTSNDFVQKMADSVGSLVRSDHETQIIALEARIALYRREGRPPQHVAALERQLAIYRRGGSLNELSADDRRFADADLGTATGPMRPLDHNIGNWPEEP